MNWTNDYSDEHAQTQYAATNYPPSASQHGTASVGVGSVHELECRMRVVVQTPDQARIHLVLCMYVVQVLVKLMMAEKICGLQYRDAELVQTFTYSLEPAKCTLCDDSGGGYDDNDSGEDDNGRWCVTGQHWRRRERRTKAEHNPTRPRLGVLWSPGCA